MSVGGFYHCVLDVYTDSLKGLSTILKALGNSSELERDHWDLVSYCSVRYTIPLSPGTQSRLLGSNN